MREPLSIISKWMTRGGDLLSPPPLVQHSYRQVAREDEAAAQHWADWSAGELEGLLQIVDQQRLEFSEEDEHANVRAAVARYLESVVLPEVADPVVWKLPERLRNARLAGTMMYNPQAQKFVTLWDEKAGLPLLCPDDAREEAMRLQRRYVPILAEWRNSGKAVHYGVFTTPNVAPGQLREEMRRICKRLVKLLWKSKRFPQIKGMLVTLEAPLAWDRTWNVHLNVLLMCDGWLDYGELRRAWHWNVELQRVRVDPRDGEDYTEAIKRAMRELVKYPVQAMPAKSQAKASQGSPLSAADSGTAGSDAPETLSRGAPPMIEWTATEWLEWWGAHQRFRRTRSYGALYGVAKPEPESLDGFVAVGFVSRDGSTLIRRLTLLDSIPGDKSSGMDYRERLKAHLRRLLGDPNRPKSALATMRAAMHAWHATH